VSRSAHIDSPDLGLAAGPFTQRSDKTAGHRPPKQQADNQTSPQKDSKENPLGRSVAPQANSRDWKRLTTVS